MEIRNIFQKRKYFEKKKIDAVNNFFQKTNYFDISMLEIGIYPKQQNAFYLYGIVSEAYLRWLSSS